MARLWHDALGAEVDCADTSDDAVEMLKSNNYDVVLVNRVLAADESSGLEAISRLLEMGLRTPVMLVSDLSEAQDSAVRLGAVRGFGKAHLGERSTLKLVSHVASAHKKKSRKES
jgi:DNA-binding response OmpR family regulator